MILWGNLLTSCRLPSPAALRIEGLCPLMPEETVLMLAALGFNRRTRIFLAGSHIYGGKSRLAVLTTLFPNLVTKENLLSSSEIEPFMNFTSQVRLVLLFPILSTFLDIKNVLMYPLLNIKISYPRFKIWDTFSFLGLSSDMISLIYYYFVTIVSSISLPVLNS